MLWAKTNFSFLEGASHPAELVRTAAEMGHRYLAITDRDGVYGIARAFVEARDSQTSMKIIYGAQLSVLDDAPPRALETWTKEAVDTLPYSSLIVLAQSREGYRTLGNLISKGRLRCPKGRGRVTWQEIFDHTNDLIALWGGDESLIASDAKGALFDHVCFDLKDAFGENLYALVARHHRADEVAQEGRVVARAHYLEIDIVPSPEVLYHTPTRRRLQDVVTCVRHKTTLDEAGGILRENHHYGIPTRDELAERYSDHPEWLQRADHVASLCNFSLSELRYVYPSERLPDGTTSSGWLSLLAHEGARWRYEGKVPDDVKKQLDRELAIIGELDYAGYFLTMWEIVDYCKKNQILCQGRGSAANSIVCYCLGITAIDPIKLDLLFERFISTERAEPPDIDLDISHERREEVIQHTYQKYGRTHAAMVANFVRYRPKSAVRDIGKVLGLSETFIDRIAKMLSHYEAPQPEDLILAGVNPNKLSDRVRTMLTLSEEILDFPRHLSIHPGGFLLGHEPVSDLVPIENASMPDRTVIQWDKYDVEDLGLFKVDLLGLGALTQLDKGYKMIAKHRHVDLSMATLPPDDPQTYDMICAADTVGTFQIESRAQMAMLPRLRPRKFYDLAIEVGIVRPGPISGDMVHPYLRRRNGEEPITYPHPCLEPVLKKTLGIPLFQEQVMKLAVVAADYTPGEADQLRRDMAAWRSSGRIEKHREKLINRMVKKGIEAEFAQRVFDQIRGFGEYGFPESHAASFALITYATCYMKCHYPVEFAASLLNAQPMGFYSPATIVDDAKRKGAQFFPIDIDRSDWDCTLEEIGFQTAEFGVRMGLRYIKGIRASEGERILEARTERPFDSVRDFTVRTGCSPQTLERLAQAGGFECLGISRRDALWQVQGLRSGTLPLPFESSGESIAFPELSRLESITWDYQTSFHSSRGHPLATLRSELKHQGLPSAADIATSPNGSYVHYAGMVICRQRPMTAAGVIFMTLEDETGFANLVIWPKVYEEQRILVKSLAFMGVSGRLQNQHNVTHLIVDKIWTPHVEAGPPERSSRDFH